eukprot:CAMPEP_0175830180 /NCGR_PEP_ID=MMETSP0107_2-20121207/13784_1 /TAXON_ID=195067 ORGANISM="Goniomonas pacifica, Strain CCMP1869" /NCGR_SAMPLE_ID=MMETSP0107_2 /ASSEMBLY_ACC=CAM_ASM_000203 /LENGTH=44 /DNA_ID=CAMNT_0017143115 /DNA_START=66 /DNA_END=197 /DNA_ORIENTATION=+
MIAGCLALGSNLRKKEGRSRETGHLLEKRIRAGRLKPRRKRLVR